MNRDDIRKMIQVNNLTSSSTGLLGVMVRTFEQLQDLDEQLEGGSITEKDLRQLRTENAALEQSIDNTKAEIVQAGKDTDAARKKAQDELESLKQRGSEMNGRIKSLEAECDGIRQEIKSLSDKPLEMKRLKGKLEELRTENKALQQELGCLGEDYQRQAGLHKRLAEFVEKIESLEARMSKTMDDIWRGLKKDAFDRSMNDARIN